jgi:redox-sensitive bicupin YhaK (pirin superfamily)
VNRVLPANAADELTTRAYLGVAPCRNVVDERDIELVIDARARDAGGLAVRRVLPSVQRRMVGPFIFFDYFGPVDLPPDRPVAVRPHPHIHLATVTYLFEGEMIHRDSLGSHQAIRPGAINWMTAGRGIVHSERSEPGVTRRMHGIQLWCALPTAHEETEPTFVHHPADTLPSITEDGVTIRVLAGEAFGARSPVATLSRLFYVDASAPRAATIAMPDYPERAVFIVAGAVLADGARFEPGHLLVLAGGRAVRLEVEAGTRLVVLGGDPLDGPRHIYWNFVSSSRERIEEAKRAWREGRFPKVPGDEIESIPLPDD